MCKDKIGERIIETFQELIDQSDLNIRFAVLTGSRAARRARPDSDVDMVTVVDPCSDTPKKIIQFAQASIRAQLKLGITPDYEYPCDVLSVEQLQDTVNGRCLRSCNGDLITNEEDSEYDYRVWLYEMITHNFDLMGGSEDELVVATREALDLTLLIAMVPTRRSRISIDNLRWLITRCSKRQYRLNRNQTDLLIEQINRSKFGQAKDGIVIYDPEVAKTCLAEKFETDFNARRLIEWFLLRSRE